MIRMVRPAYLAAEAAASIADEAAPIADDAASAAAPIASEAAAEAASITGAAAGGAAGISSGFLPQAPSAASEIREANSNDLFMRILV